MAVGMGLPVEVTSAIVGKSVDGECCEDLATDSEVELTLQLEVMLEVAAD